MGQHTTTVTRRQLLAGVGTLGLASAGAGAGTMALFADTESSTGNTISSGTLDLTLNGSDSTVSFLTQTNIAPGESGSAQLTVSNAGSIDGYIEVSVASLSTPENGYTGNENSVDSSPNTGELQDYLEVEAVFHNGSNLWGGYDTVDPVLLPGSEYDTEDTLAAGAADTFELRWRLPSNTGDIAQGDGVQFDLTFHLDQTTDGGA